MEGVGIVPFTLLRWSAIKIESMYTIMATLGDDSFLGDDGLGMDFVDCSWGLEGFGRFLPE